MPKYDIREVRDMSDQDIIDTIEDLKESLQKFRFERATQQLANPRSITDARKKIAQLKMVQHERLLATAQVQKEQKS
jgi:ribosomal protein L29